MLVVPTISAGLAICSTCARSLTLYDRPVESVQCKESNHATEPGLSQPPRSSTEPLSSSPVGDGVGAARRSLARRSARDPRTSHRPHDLGQVDEGGKR